MSDEHICTACFQPSGRHRERCHQGSDHRHWPPLCCPGCDCGSYEDVHPSTAIPSWAVEDLTKATAPLTRELIVHVLGLAGAQRAVQVTTGLPESCHMVGVSRPNVDTLGLARSGVPTNYGMVYLFTPTWLYEQMAALLKDHPIETAG